MRSTIMGAITAALIAVGLNAPAGAAPVTYQFTMTGPVDYSQAVLGPPPYPHLYHPPGYIQGHITFSSRAVAQGYSINHFYNRFNVIGSTTTPIDWSDTEIEEFAFRSYGMSLSLDMFQYIFQPYIYGQNVGSPLVDWAFRINLDRDGNLYGHFHYYNSPDDKAIDLTFNSVSGSGWFADGSAYCGYCRFQGEMTRVPEPISLALLATGLLGLGVARYRRSNAS